MDFHILSRKELQTLCKKNKIPANITNVAMADALSALQHVEGLEELLDHPKSDPQQSPEKTIPVPDVPRTACGTSTRKKPVRSNALETPAAPASRRRAPASSVRHKEESSVQRVYGTRRSVRLLEKNMEKLSLMEDGKPGPSKIDGLTREIFSGSEDFVAISFEKGESMQPSTEVSSEKNEDMEILSKLKSEGALENYNHEDFKSKSELEPEVEAREEGSGESDNHLAEKPEEIMDVKDENKDGKGPDVELVKFQSESQNSDEDLKLDNVMNEVVVAQTSVLQELLNEEVCAPCPSEMEAVEVKSLTSAEESVKHEGVVLSFSAEQSHIFKSEGSVINVAENEFHGQFDFEADSVTEEESENGSSEEESEDVSSEESNDYQSEDDVTEGDLSVENLSEFQETGYEFELRQRHAVSDFDGEKSSNGDNLVSCTVGCSMFEMNESIAKELTDVDVIEADITTGSHPLMKQVPCDMVSSGEVEFSTSSITNGKNPCHADITMGEDYGPLVDVYVSVEDFDSAMTPETPSSVKKMSPHQGNMTSGDEFTGESAFASNQLSGQFPRPTLSASRNSPVPQRDVVDINEEDDEKVEEDEVKENKGVCYEGLSLRKLNKMLKQKLEIANNKTNIEDKHDAKHRVGKIRTALQTLPENRMAINKPAEE